MLLHQVKPVLCIDFTSVISEVKLEWDGIGRARKVEGTRSRMGRNGRNWVVGEVGGEGTSRLLDVTISHLIIISYLSVTSLSGEHLCTGDIPVGQGNRS